MLTEMVRGFMGTLSQDGDIHDLHTIKIKKKRNLNWPDEAKYSVEETVYVNSMIEPKNDVQYHQYLVQFIISRNHHPKMFI